MNAKRISPLHRWSVLVLTAGLIQTVDLRAQPGSLDTNFHAAATVGGWGFTAAVQPDGKVLAAGNFGIMRFLPDGSTDPDFQIVLPGIVPSTGAGGGNRTLALQPDGKILVAGDLADATDAPLPRLMCLNADGSIDPSFHLDARAFPVGRVLAVQPDGRIITDGHYERGGEDFGSLIRLLPDGNLDPGWDARWYNSSSSLYSLALTPEGTIYFGNYETVYRVNRDGSLDRDFEPELYLGPYAALAVQPDGKLIVGHYGDGGGYGQIRRLLSSGLADPAWTRPEVGGGDSVVYALLLQPDGKVLVGGNNLMSFNGIQNASLGRLNRDGSVDTTFDTQADQRLFSVEDLTLAADGKVIVAGYHVNIPSGYLPEAGICRLNNDAGPRDIEFATASRTVHEGDGWVSIPVQRTGNANRVALVSYSAYAGSATRNRDYLGGDGVLLFKRGETVKHIRLYILRDQRAEDYETVRLRLDRSLGGKLGPQSQTVVTILDR